MQTNPQSEVDLTVSSYNPCKQQVMHVHMGVVRDTVRESVDPIVAEVHSKEGKPPSPCRVPGQLYLPVMLPDIDVSAQFTAFH